MKACATFLACACSTLVMAGDAPHCPRPISFALYENGYIYNTASNSGIDKDVAEALAKRSGCVFELQVKPRARIWAELERGDLMMTGSGIRTEQRDAFCWTVRYMAQKNYVVIRKDSAARSAAQFAANPAWLWGAVRSYRHGDQADAFLTQLRAQSRVVDEADLAAVFRVFSLPQRTTALFAPPPAYAKYIKEMGLADRVRIEDWFAEDPPIPHNLIFSKSSFSAAEMEKWRAIVAQMRADGTLTEIYRKHLGAEDAERMLQYKPD